MSHYTVQYDSSKGPDTKAEREKQALAACKDYICNAQKFKEILALIRNVWNGEGTRTDKYRTISFTLSFGGISGYWVVRALIKEANK